MALALDRFDYEQRGKMRAVARLAVFAVSATPLVLLPNFFFPFVTTRNVFFRLCVEAALAAVLLGGVRRLRDVDSGSDGVLRWFAFYIVVLALTAMTGVAPWHSVFGDFERMGGVFAWLHLFLFYCVLRIVMREGDWIVFFRLVVAAADVIVLFGAGQFLPLSIRNPLFQTTLDAGSTIGNQGLLGPYLLLALVFSVWDLTHSSSRLWRTAAALSSCILLFGIAGSRNRSSELGLLVGLGIGTCVFIYFSDNRKRVARRVLLAGTAAAAVLFAATAILSMRAPDIAEHLGERWRGFLSSPIDHARTIEWKIALQGFADRPIFGYGPENHQVVASHHFDPRIYAILGESVFDRAHNAWLELLATSGILGGVAMAGMWIAVIATLRRGVKTGSLSVAEAATISGALAAYAIYLTFWFFDVNSVTLWIALIAYLSSRVNGVLQVSPDHGRRAHPFAWATVAITALAAYFHGVIPLRAARDLSTAAGSGTFETRLMAFQNVLNSPAPQTMHTFPLYYRFLRNAEPQLARFDTNPVLRKEFDLAMQRALIEADRTIARNKTDDRSYVDAARLFSLAGLYYSDARYVERAKKELLKAVRISPRRPDARVLLSGLYLTLRDSAAATVQLDSAMAFAPDFLPVFVYAAKLQLARGNVDSSASLLLRAVSGRPMPVETLLQTVIDSLGAHGENGRAAHLAERYLESVFGPEDKWARLPDFLRSNAFAMQMAGVLPILYVRAGDNADALRTARNLAILQPGARTAAAQFTADVRSGAASRWTSRPTLIPVAPTMGSGTSAGNGPAR